MAAIQDQAALDFASSLNQADIPIKLRCAICNKLAVNAFKLPCCEQSICQDCQASLPESCPVCTHSPLQADMCKQNKSLRLTIKAFIKSEEKKRAAAIVESTPVVEATPVTAIISEPAAVSAEQGQPDDNERSSVQAANDEIHRQLPDTVFEPESIPTGPTDPLDQVEQVSTDHEPTAAADDQTNQASGNGDEDIVQTTETEDPQVEEQGEEGQKEINGEEGGQDQNNGQAMNNGFGFNGGNQTMDWNAANGFNPMMMNMPGMQNAWGGFPNMMGMPGMNMGQVSMYGGFGAGGMGMQDMSAMNMGMGFGGGFGGNWNGQQQGMGGNFYPNAGYNQPQMHQGNYGNNQMNHHQQFQSHNYQGRFHGQRGYGRGGRGGYAGRGGYVNRYQSQQNGFHSGNGQGGGERYAQQSSAEYQGDNSVAHTGETAEFSTERRGSQSVVPVDDAQTERAAAPEEIAQDAEATTNEAISTQQASGALEQDGAGADENMNQDTEGQQDYQVSENMNQGGFDSTAGQDYDRGINQEYPAEPSMDGNYYAEHQQYNGYAGRGRGGHGRGNFRGRGGFARQQSGFSGSDMGQGDFTVVAGGVPQGPPINAPTGPKAMREGLPNSGMYSRGGAFAARSGGHSAATPAPAATPSVTGAEQDHRSVSQPEETLDKMAAEELFRSSSQHRKRKHRHRSTSIASEHEPEAHERKRERRRRHEEDYGESSQVDNDIPSRKERSRSSSREDDSRRRHRRSEKEKHRSSRSHREPSRESRRHRHRSRSPQKDHTNGVEDLTSESSHRRSRNHRDRERDRPRSDRDKDKDKDRKRSRRDRSLSADHRSSSRRHSRRDDNQKDDSRRDDVRRDDARERDMAPPDDIGFKIKGSRAAKATSTAAASFAPPSGPRKDRDRDRHDDRERKDKSRRPSIQSVVDKPAPAPAAAVDPYAQEREERQRARVLKEQQRRESAVVSEQAPTGPRAERNGGGGRESGREGGGRTRKGKDRDRERRHSYKYEDEENDERRASRVEKEREAGRWG